MLSNFTLHTANNADRSLYDDHLFCNFAGILNMCNLNVHLEMHQIHHLLIHFCGVIKSDSFNYDSYSVSALHVASTVAIVSPSFKPQDFMPS